MTKLKNYNLSGAADLQTWNSISWNNSGLIWNNTAQDWIPMKSGNLSPLEARVLYKSSSNVWTYASSQKLSGGTIIGHIKYPPITFSVANIRLSANQNINLARFDCSPTTRAHIFQASACGSGGTSISGLSIQMLGSSSFPLNGSNNVYKTSSQIIQLGYPLATSALGDHIEVRLMYSGTQSNLTGVKFGTGFMNISVY